MKRLNRSQFALVYAVARLPQSGATLDVGTSMLVDRGELSDSSRERAAHRDDWGEPLRTFQIRAPRSSSSATWIAKVA